MNSTLRPFVMAGLVGSTMIVAAARPALTQTTQSVVLPGVSRADLQNLVIEIEKRRRTVPDLLPATD